MCIRDSSDTVRDMCIQATHVLSDDMAAAMNHAIETEKSPLGKQVLKQLEDNLKIAGEEIDVYKRQVYRHGRTKS